MSATSSNIDDTVLDPPRSLLKGIDTLMCEPEFSLRVVSVYPSGLVILIK